MIEKTVRCDHCKTALGESEPGNTAPSFRPGTIEFNSVAFKDFNQVVHMWSCVHFCAPDCVKNWLHNNWPQPEQRKPLTSERP